MCVVIRVKVIFKKEKRREENEGGPIAVALNGLCGPGYLQAVL